MFVVVNLRIEPNLSLLENTDDCLLQLVIWHISGLRVIYTNQDILARFDVVPIGSHNLIYSAANSVASRRTASAFSSDDCLTEKARITRATTACIGSS